MERGYQEMVDVIPLENNLWNKSCLMVDLLKKLYLIRIISNKILKIKGTVHSSDIRAKSLANGSLMIVL